GDEADFFRATFGDEAVFGGATFGDRAVFAEATFGERADFFRATFSDKADFGEATFGDRAYFREATFGDEADFLWATFGERAGFEEATFGDGARFLGATFGDWARFLRATFGSRLSFAEATIGPRSSFNSTRFKGSSTFNQAKIQEGVTFSNNTFPDQTDFDRACIGDNVRFSEVTFDNISSFSEAEFGKQVIFSKCDFKQPALFRNPLSITDLRFQDMTAEQFKNADFIHCPLKDVTFTNIEWPRHYKEDRYHLPIEDNDNINKKAVADFYRQMKKRSIDEQNQAEASFWHFAEKEAFRKHLKASKDKLLLRFYTGTYRFISHYGESPTRALVVLAGLLALLAVVVALGGFAIHGIKPPAFYSERLGKFFLTFGQYALLTTPTYTLPPGYAAIALVISRLFIPIQAAIFGFALRNKLRR
ncbi:MAG: pentapeptide repeat-containing protein, partial [Thermodesulfobacteriota bacterium]